LRGSRPRRRAPAGGPRPHVSPQGRRPLRRTAGVLGDVDAVGHHAGPDAVVGGEDLPPHVGHGEHQIRFEDRGALAVHQDLAGEVVHVVHRADHRDVVPRIPDPGGRTGADAVLRVQDRPGCPLDQLEQALLQAVDAAGHLLLEVGRTHRPRDEEERHPHGPEEAGGRVPEGDHAHFDAEVVQGLGQLERVHHTPARLGRVRQQRDRPLRHGASSPALVGAVPRDALPMRDLAGPVTGPPRRARAHDGPGRPQRRRPGRCLRHDRARLLQDGSLPRVDLRIGLRTQQVGDDLRAALGHERGADRGELAGRVHMAAVADDDIEQDDRDRRIVRGGS
jgi:hypothetical protein